MKKNFLFLPLVTTFFLYSACSGPTLHKRLSTAVKRQDSDELVSILDEIKTDDSSPINHSWSAPCLALGRLRDKRAVPCLSKFLHHDMAYESEIAATLLGDIDYGQGPIDSNVIEGLITSLQAKKVKEHAYYKVTIPYVLAVTFDGYKHLGEPRFFSDMFFWFTFLFRARSPSNTDAIWGRTIVIFPGEYMINEDFPIKDFRIALFSASRVTDDTLGFTYGPSGGPYRFPNNYGFGDTIQEEYHETEYSDKIQDISLNSLRKITGKDLGKSQPQWIEWWHQERKTGLYRNETSATVLSLQTIGKLTSVEEDSEDRDSLVLILDIPTEIVRLPFDQYRKAVTAIAERTVNDLMLRNPALKQWHLVLGRVEKTQAVLKYIGPYIGIDNEIKEHGLERWNYWADLEVQNIKYK